MVGNVGSILYYFIITAGFQNSIINLHKSVSELALLLAYCLYVGYYARPVNMQWGSWAEWRWRYSYTLPHANVMGH